MKKQINKITLKTDKIVSLSKNQAQNMNGGMMPVTKHADCLTCLGCISKFVC